eukprot:GFYU01003857.1.p1 GENE.GFYU01003857.1~~GFYU01003857.1.p1  ORF type:complete len:352 (+),score=94.72 GFYU01003857.1:174-1229(+)
MGACGSKQDDAPKGLLETSLPDVWTVKHVPYPMNSCLVKHSPSYADGLEVEDRVTEPFWVMYNPGRTTENEAATKVKELVEPDGGIKYFVTTDREGSNNEVVQFSAWASVFPDATWIVTSREGIKKRGLPAKNTRVVVANAPFPIPELTGDKGVAFFPFPKVKDPNPKYKDKYTDLVCIDKANKLVIDCSTQRAGQGFMIMARSESEVKWVDLGVEGTIKYRNNINPKDEQGNGAQDPKLVGYAVHRMHAVMKEVQPKYWFAGDSSVKNNGVFEAASAAAVIQMYAAYRDSFPAPCKIDDLFEGMANLEDMKEDFDEKMEQFEEMFGVDLKDAAKSGIKAGLGYLSDAMSE